MSRFPAILSTLALGLVLFTGGAFMPAQSQTLYEGARLITGDGTAAWRSMAAACAD